MRNIFKGSTGHSEYIVLVDSTTGLPKTGIADTVVTGSYVRTRAARVAITMSALGAATSAYSSGGWFEVDGTNQPGVYRIDVPDAAFASGVDQAYVTVKATGCKTETKEFRLVDWNDQVAAIPNAAAAAAGGLPTFGTGTGQLNVTGGRADADVLRWNGTAVATPATAGIPDVNVKNIDNDAASASGTVTFPNATLASTANITAGTITTVTNLTNAPTSGDLTATMKTSVTTAATAATPTAAAVTGAVGSVTGNVGGNVVGSVASVTAGVTVTTNNDKTGYGISAAAVQGIWDALTSALTTPGSIGKRIVDFLTGDAYARLGAPVGASISADIAGVQSDTDNLQTRLPAALVGGRMDSSTGAMAADVLTAAAVASDAVTEIQTGISTLTAAGVRTAVGLATANLDTQLSGINAKTTNLPTDPADESLLEAAIAAIAAPSAAAVASQVRTELTTELGRIDAAMTTRLATAGYTAPPTANANADALLNRDMSAVTVTSARSPINALRFMRNRWTVLAGLLTVYAEDDTTVAWTATLLSDAAADPVTGSDPA